MHDYQRIRFRLTNADTGVTATSGDTGPPVWGEIRSIQFVPDDTGLADTGNTAGGDTGTGNNFAVHILPVDGDTSGGRGIFQATNSTTGATVTTRPLSHQAIYYPYTPAHTGGGIQTHSDTGHNGVYPVAAGERIRVKYTSAHTTNDSGNDATIYITVAG